MYKLIKTRNIKKIATNLILLFMVAFLLAPGAALAEPMPGCEVPAATETYRPIKINFPLPNITSKNPLEEVGGKFVQTYSVKDLQCFTIGIYIYFAGIVGILATVMIMYGGVKYVISMGSPQRMSDAKDTIFSAVVGLVLVLGAYILLNLINPNLTELKVAGLNPIQPVSSISPHDPNGPCGQDVYNYSCGESFQKTVVDEKGFTQDIVCCGRGCTTSNYECKRVIPGANPIGVGCPSTAVESNQVYYQCLQQTAEEICCPSGGANLFCNGGLDAEVCDQNDCQWKCPNNYGQPASGIQGITGTPAQ